MWTNSNDAIKAIESRRNHHKNLSLFQKAMQELGNPQDQLKSIHVGGTNGKGSTVNYIRSILNAAEYRVGTFTSPYLVSHHDRIRIDDQPIRDEDLLDLINQTEEIWRKYDLSMFEIDMMLASLYFVKEKVDLAIFEVGMGGRLDATNILKKPLVSVITNIGMDHMQYLGNTLDLIAQEKAGIIKDEVACVSATENEECLEIFQNMCELHQSQFLTTQKIDEEAENFIYCGHAYALKSLARYQRKNAALAIEVINYLKNADLIQIHEEEIKTGLENTEWAGRFEVISDDPKIILDGAHNLDGMKELVNTIRHYPNVHVIFSCLKDKNGIEMIQELLSVTKDITFCEFENERADSAFHFKDFPLVFDDDLQKCLEEAFHHDGVVLICGSLYFVSVARKKLLEIKEKELKKAR